MKKLLVALVAGLALAACSHNQESAPATASAVVASAPEASASVVASAPEASAPEASAAK